MNEETNENNINNGEEQKIENAFSDLISQLFDENTEGTTEKASGATTYNASENTPYSDNGTIAYSKGGTNDEPIVTVDVGNTSTEYGANGVVTYGENGTPIAEATVAGNTSAGYEVGSYTEPYADNTGSYDANAATGTPTNISVNATSTPSISGDTNYGTLNTPVTATGYDIEKEYNEYNQITNGNTTVVNPNGNANVNPSTTYEKAVNVGGLYNKLGTINTENITPTGVYGEVPVNTTLDTTVNETTEDYTSTTAGTTDDTGFKVTQSNLPAKIGFWTKVRNFFMVESKIEYSVPQDEPTNTGFWNKLHNFFSFGKNK